MPSTTRFLLAGIALTVKTWTAQTDLHPAVVLLPATAETADTWDLVAEPLARTRNVYGVNLRGHGGSDWPGTYSVASMATDVAALLPQLADAPVDLIGHSLGGLVACDVAAAQPQLVRRLIVEDVGLLRPRPTRVPTKPEGDLPFDWRMVEQIRPEIDSPDPRWPGVAAAIRAPVLVVAGGPSSPIPQEHVADLARAVRIGACITIDAGHFVHEVEPAAFLRAATRFLDEPEPS